MNSRSRSAAHSDGSPSIYSRTAVACVAVSAAPGVDDSKTRVSDDVAPSGRRVAAGAQTIGLKPASTSVMADDATLYAVLKVHDTPLTAAVSRIVPRATSSNAAGPSLSGLPENWTIAHEGNGRR